jgi:3-deoxy-manno-octulosonate cytidylyltransferase (CMP-KDO synthetase)
MNPKVIGVIPARYASTRFPGKPLAMIAGREMIKWVIEGAKTSRLLQEVIVATDDERIAEASRAVGAKVAMTNSDLPSGTDRIWAAIEKIECDVVINIQGDEPLVTAEWIDALAEPLIREPDLEMATLAHPISNEELQSPNAVKVVVDQRGNGLYFSRFPIPYSREAASASGLVGALKHIGMYGYRKNFLQQFCAAKQAEIEKAESLEQLRALYLGAKIRVVKVATRSYGIDTPEDIKNVEAILNKGMP